jgi:hypothetical protein
VTFSKWPEDKPRLRCVKKGVNQSALSDLMPPLKDLARGRGDADNSTEATRRLIVRSVIAVGSLFLIAAGILGLIRGNFTALNAVWQSLLSILTLVFGYYLGSATNQHESRSNRFVP